MIDDGRFFLKFFLRCIVFLFLILVFVGEGFFDVKLIFGVFVFEGKLIVGVFCCLVEILFLKGKFIFSDKLFLVFRVFDNRLVLDNVFLILGFLEVFIFEGLNDLEVIDVVVVSEFGVIVGRVEELVCFGIFELLEL